MQDNQDNQGRPSARPRLGRTRFVGLDPADPATTDPLPATTRPLSATPGEERTDRATTSTLKRATTILPTGVYTGRSVENLLQLSGMLRPLRQSGTTRKLVLQDGDEDSYWPLGIHQIGPLASANIYGRQAFGRTLPSAVPLVLPVSAGQSSTDKQPLWLKVLRSPAFKLSMGLLVGVGLLCLTVLFVSPTQVLHLLVTRLTTWPNMDWGVLAGVAFLAAHSIRGLRWRLFLRPLGLVSWSQAIGIYQIATFLNFFLPLHSGEVSKSLIVKRLTRIPTNQSLITVGIDKSLDMLAALVIIVLVPLLGIHMNLPLWIVFALAAALLLGALILLSLSTWRRSSAILTLQRIFGFFPKTISTKVEGFALGFVDGLQAGISKPLLFLPALVLTALAVGCDALFMFLSFQAIGYAPVFSSMLFGYMVYKLFSILPTPPGQLGSYEILGLLVFSGLLHLPGNQVAAMYLFSHLWSALLLCLAGLFSVFACNLKFSHLLQSPVEASNKEKKTTATPQK